MPEFTNPGFLAFIPVAIVVVWWLARRVRPAIRYTNLAILGSISSGRARRAVWGSAILRGLALLSLILACTGPRLPDLRTRIPAEGIAIVMALDVSGSMAERDVNWSNGASPISRLEAAKRAFKLFVDGGEAPDGTHFDPRPADAIGLVTFALLPRTACPLTLNHSVLLQLVESQEAKSGLDAGTNIGDAIVESLARLDGGARDRKKILILLSDGEHNASKEGPDDPLKPRQAAQLAANLGIRIYSIDAGGTLPPEASAEAIQQRQMGEEALRAISIRTGGKSFAASNGAEFLAAYREISSLEKAPLESFQYRRYRELYPWCAGVAVILLAVVYCLDRTLWRISP